MFSLKFETKQDNILNSCSDDLYEFAKRMLKEKEMKNDEKSI